MYNDTLSFSAALVVLRYPTRRQAKRLQVHNPTTRTRNRKMTRQSGVTLVICERGLMREGEQGRLYSSTLWTFTQLYCNAPTSMALVCSESFGRSDKRRKAIWSRKFNPTIRGGPWPAGTRSRHGVFVSCIFLSLWINRV